MMQHILELTLRVDEEHIEVDVYEPETGEIKQLDMAYSPDEHPKFDKALGDEVYSWLSMWQESESEITELCTFPDDDEDYCKVFSVDTGWLEKYLVRCVHDRPSVHAFLNSYTWDETWFIYLTAKAEGQLLSEEEQK